MQPDLAQDQSVQKSPDGKGCHRGQPSIQSPAPSCTDLLWTIVAHTHHTLYIRRTLTNSQHQSINQSIDLQHKKGPQLHSWQFKQICLLFHTDQRPQSCMCQVESWFFEQRDINCFDYMVDGQLLVTFIDNCVWRNITTSSLPHYVHWAVYVLCHRNTTALHKCIYTVHTGTYNTIIQYKTCNVPYVTRMLFVGAGMTRD